MTINHFEPQIVLKTFDLYLNFYPEIRQWPKPERYNLGRHTEELILDVLEKFLAAARNFDRKDNLVRANIKLQVLKCLFRLAKETNIMTERKYLFFEIKTMEIGQMLGGWLKTV